jgi:hypothetical protein
MSYKDEIQAIFEEMVHEKFGRIVEYWDLPNDVQYEMYRKATDEFFDRMADRADYLRKAEREGK